MTPYETACDRFHEVNHSLDWSELLTRRFRDPRGFILSTGDCFAVAQWVDDNSMEVEAAAGSLKSLLDHIPDGVDTLYFQRRDDQYHRVSVGRLRCRKSFIGKFQSRRQRAACEKVKAT